MASGRIRLQIAVGIDRIDAVAEEEARPDGNIGVLQAARHETVGPLLRIGEGFGRLHHFVEGLRVGEALLGEEILVPVHHPVIDRERQRQHLALRVLGIEQTSLREVALGEAGLRKVRVLHECAESASQPAFSNWRFCT